MVHEIENASTPQSRAIKALRKRARKYGDNYLNLVAEEFDKTYRLMIKARRALLIIEKTATDGLDVSERPCDTAPANSSECPQTDGLPYSLLGKGVLKPLEWKEAWSGSNEDIPVWIGANSLNIYISVCFAGIYDLQKHSDVDAAELASRMKDAEAEYQARVLSSFSEAPDILKPEDGAEILGFIQENAREHLLKYGAASILAHEDADLGYTIPVSKDRFPGKASETVQGGAYDV